MAAKPKTAAPKAPMAGRATRSTPLPESLADVAVTPADEAVAPAALPVTPVAELLTSPAMLPAMEVAALTAESISERAEERAAASVMVAALSARLLTLARMDEIAVLVLTSAEASDSKELTSSCA